MGAVDRNIFKVVLKTRKFPWLLEKTLDYMDGRGWIRDVKQRVVGIQEELKDTTKKTWGVLIIVSRVRENNKGDIFKHLCRLQRKGKICIIWPLLKSSSPVFYSSNNQNNNVGMRSGKCLIFEIAFLRACWNSRNILFQLFSRSHHWLKMESNECNKI